jgi:Ni/Co efflux regulator RcnB
MNRRTFLHAAMSGAGSSLLLPARVRAAQDRRLRGGLRSDVVIVGGGLGGVAAALAALRGGLRVTLSEPTDWIGGQLTQQAVPLDEHRWIESHGATNTYRQLRVAIRDYYRRNYPLAAGLRSQPNLNPGLGSVSRLCCEPRVALAALEALLAPYRAAGQLTVLLEHDPIAATMAQRRVDSVVVRNKVTGKTVALEARWFVDASELGDLLPPAPRGMEHWRIRRLTDRILPRSKLRSARCAGKPIPTDRVPEETAVRRGGACLAGLAEPRTGRVANGPLPTDCRISRSAEWRLPRRPTG